MFIYHTPCSFCSLGYTVGCTTKKKSNPCTHLLLWTVFLDTPTQGLQLCSYVIPPVSFVPWLIKRGAPLKKKITHARSSNCGLCSLHLYPRVAKKRNQCLHL